MNYRNFCWDSFFSLSWRWNP